MHHLELPWFHKLSQHHVESIGMLLQLTLGRTINRTWDPVSEREVGIESKRKESIMLL